MAWWHRQVDEVDEVALQRLRRQPDELIDRVVRCLAAEIDVPLCAVAILGKEAEWILSGVGVGGTELHRSLALSDLDLDGPVVDAREHPILGGHPWVEATPRVRSVIVEPIELDGVRAGSLVAMDVVLREFSPAAQQRVADAADLIRGMLQVRRRVHSITDIASNGDAFVRHLLHVVSGPNRRAAMCAKLAREALNEGDAEAADTYLGYVEQQSGHAMRLVAELGRFLRPGVEVDVQSTDVQSAVELAWRTVEPAALTLDMRLGPTHIFAHPTHLASVFIELFRNAMQHAGPDATTVTVRTVRTMDTSWVEVLDDGVGISAGLCTEVLKPLVRGSSRVPGALGLGLAEVVRAVQGWGGEVDVAPRTDGPGLRVRFSESQSGPGSESPVPGSRRLEPRR